MGMTAVKGRLTATVCLVPSMSRIEASHERDHYWKVMCTLWNLPPTSRKPPGCNPMSLSRARLPDLSAQTYGITLKSDGVKYYLLLTTRPVAAVDGDVAPVALMIDRARNMYEVEVVAPEDYFVKGTLLEGELVWSQPNETELRYLVFDAACVKGECLATCRFDERLRRAEACTRWSEELAKTPDLLEARVLELDAIALVHFRPPLVMRPKHFVALQHAEKLWSARNDCGHRVDGLILQRYDTPYVHGTVEDGSTFKWKEHSSVDLQRVSDGRLRAADAPLPETLLGRRVVVETSRVAELAPANAILEYVVTVADGAVSLFPTRTRPDKTSANGLRVVVATVQDVVDAVTPAELALQSES